MWNELNDLIENLSEQSGYYNYYHNIKGSWNMQMRQELNSSNNGITQFRLGMGKR